jgi:adenylate kinase
MATIIVSGTPGTGKTTLSKKLAEKLDFKYVDVNRIIKRFKLIEGYDEARQTNIVNVLKLNSVLIQFIKQGKNLLIDSHLSHNLPAKYVDLCIITKCNLKELKKRLERKRWPESKIRENMDAEIFDICYVEAKEQKHRILIVDTTKGVDIGKLVKKIKTRLKIK